MDSKEIESKVKEIGKKVAEVSKSAFDKASVKDVNGMLQIRFTSKAFLRYQVRFMVGAILSYCDNKLTLFQIRRLLNGEDIKRQKLKAEAKGLYLEHISYPEIEEKEIAEISGVLFTL